jgi:hypothetical protein
LLVHLELSFNIGTGAGQGYMKAGSAYLRFEFTPTGTTPINFNGPIGHQSCASLIRTLNLNIGGLQVEQVNDYDKYYRMVQSHACNANYVEHDVQITESSSSLVLLV